MKLRINKLISDAGLGSRRDVEDYIRQGRVKINGKRAQLGDMVAPEDIVLFDEVDLPVKELIQEHLSLDKLVQKEKKDEERVRTRDKKSERAESQRLQAMSKSACLRKTSKNNPENKRAARLREELWDEDTNYVGCNIRHSSKKDYNHRSTTSKGKGGRGRFRYKDED